MRSFLVLVLSAVSFSVMAEVVQPKHLVSVGTNGLGWSGLGNKFDWDQTKSGVKDSDSSNGSIALNYSYIFPNRVMLGAEMYSESSKSETNYTSGEKESEDSQTSSLALTVGYNFNDDLFNSWWIRAAIGGGSIKTESVDTTETPSTTKSDIGLSFVTLSAGKRFSFDSWGLKNFTYSPSIDINSVSYSDDAKTSGLKTSSAVQFNVIKFDILF